MSQSIVSFDIHNGIATIVMDDGKRNVVSPEMLKQLNSALDEAEKAHAVVVLTGRDGVLSAAFGDALPGSQCVAVGMLFAGFCGGGRFSG